ncbi:hypothetical protein LAZ67_15000282 [Cordylochernes scorpioides]|uniref:Mos1 transposase HTH domain-containing protein n=1 Tax=Cordylochernes scorpioides TaxID=51811 RepID=A0ABY6L7Z5_9ARAC|nr:hypothetical protein LAZ67_15000282 [Cordylochernes scorpioides]
MAISGPKSAHLREVLLFAFNWKKSASEAHRMLEEVYSDHALSKSQCYRWFKKFQSGDFELDNELHRKPPQKFEDAELQALLDEDSTQMQEKLAKQLQVSQGAVSLRFHSLGMTQKLSRWVPHEHEKKSFLHRIVTSDEKWIHFSNPTRQKLWGLPGQFPKQTPSPIASEKRQCFAYEAPPQQVGDEDHWSNYGSDYRTLQDRLRESLRELGKLRQITRCLKCTAKERLRGLKEKRKRTSID